MSQQRVLTKVEWQEGHRGTQIARITWAENGAEYVEVHTFDDPATARTYQVTIDAVIQMQAAKR